MTTSPIPEILTHLDAGVLSLTINRLDRKNSITAVMMVAVMATSGWPVELV